MAKRIAASLLGVLAIAAGLVAFLYAFEGTEDFRNPAAMPFRFVVIGELVMFSMSLTALWVGVRLLRYAWSGDPWPEQQLGSAGTARNRVLLSRLYIFVAINGAVGATHVAR